MCSVTAQDLRGKSLLSYARPRPEFTTGLGLFIIFPFCQRGICKCCFVHTQTFYHPISIGFVCPFLETWFPRRHHTSLCFENYSFASSSPLPHTTHHPGPTGGVGPWFPNGLVGCPTAKPRCFAALKTTAHHGRCLSQARIQAYRDGARESTAVSRVRGPLRPSDHTGSGGTRRNTIHRPRHPI